ncbi:MAG: xanthan lyase [Mucilaginibacter sp.]|nr:xanthan lyase [Mucilaginibacter sp.]
MPLTKMKLIAIIPILLLAVIGCKKSNPASDTPNNSNTNSNDPNQYDIVIYGATSSGVIAAVQAVKLGKSVVLISNYARIGGMTTNGLSNTDIGNDKIVGGLTKQFYEKIGHYYGNNNPIYRFEPKAALQVFNSYISDNKIVVLYNERLLLKNGVEKADGKIKDIILESGKKIMGEEFLDTSYEGDLMAQAGVSFTIGRESNYDYNETYDGLANPFKIDVDPYINAGDPKSGLLPRISTLNSPQRGAKSDLIMSYNFRLCLTNEAGNKATITKPADYNEQQYELLFRALKKDSSISLSAMINLPGNKFDANSSGSPFSFDYLGGNRAYVNADYTTREQIKKDHQTYDQGLLWTLQNDSRVPESVRKSYSQYGLAKDEFLDNNNWPDEMYVRETRRMIGLAVLTQSNILNKVTVNDPIGMGSYKIDSHNVEFYVTNGILYAEGEVEQNINGPYGISYKAIVPQSKDCTNLLVPVCLSATHVGFCSIRLEPQYMILGQSAAIAASLAIDNNTTVQDVDYAKLKPLLLANKQILSY